jgi:TPR repeat protein
MTQAVETAKTAIEREDYDAAAALLQPLAQSGLTEAEFLMGFLYFTSANVTKQESRVWLERAAAKDHAEALFYLACLGRNIDFGQPEDDVHRGFLVRAAELGLAKAQRDLGCYYAIGGGAFAKDETLARLWYRRAAEQGHADAQYNYGLMLLHGEGGSAEPKAGIEWVRRAAARGNSGATHFLSQTAA